MHRFREKRQLKRVTKEQNQLYNQCGLTMILLSIHNCKCILFRIELLQNNYLYYIFVIEMPAVVAFYNGV